MVTILLSILIYTYNMKPLICPYLKSKLSVCFVHNFSFRSEPAMATKRSGLGVKTEEDGRV